VLILRATDTSVTERTRHAAVGGYYGQPEGAIIAGMASRIPCTVTILTFNSAGTLPRALQSVAEVAEVIVSDGGSTDGTREIVTRFGRTLIDQPASCQGPDGRLIDYGRARDQLRMFATQPWIMQLDSDEYASAELMDDLRRVCQLEGGPNQYTIEARYEVDGRLIDCATTYPMRFPRLYRGRDCRGYVGVTDEYAVVSGEQGALHSWFVIPYPPIGLMVRKWVHYLKVDRREYRSLDSAALAMRSAIHRSSVRWFVRDFRSKRSREMCRNPLPLWIEASRLSFYIARYTVTIVERCRRVLSRSA